jgi:hypothetical protein
MVYHIVKSRERYLELPQLIESMAEQNSTVKSHTLKEALSLKITDKVGFLYSLGRLSEENGLPTVSHVFFTEALEEINNSTPSNLYQQSDIELAITKLEVNHPGLTKPNVVTVHVESKNTMSTMLRDVFQNTVVRGLSLLLAGSLLPFLINSI